MNPCIIMIGDGLTTPGGISSVVRTYRDAGFFERRNIVYISNYQGAGPLRQAAVMLRAIMTFLRVRFCADVSLIHIHSASRGSFWRAALFGGLARLTGVPYLLHIHSGEFPVFYDQDCGRYAKGIVQRVFRAAAAVFCLTPGWKSKLQEISQDASLIPLPNPVHVTDDIPEAIRTTSPRILFLGRITEKKGVFDLLQAMPTVLSHHTDARLVLAGEGDIELARKYAKHLGIENSVVFAGWIQGQDKERSLKEATLVVQPSHFEAFGVSILEAMAHGKPVLATRVGGIPEILQDGVHGCLVPPNSSEALATAIVDMLADKTRLAAMGVAGYRHVLGEYSAHRILNRLGEHYDSVLFSNLISREFH